MTSQRETAAEPPASEGQVGPGRARLLITDDRPEVMAMVEGGLGQRYDCRFTKGLEQAREKLAAEAFQVAICDLQAPKEAGLVQVEEIARDYPETAIVLITDVDDPDVTERTFQLGAHGYIVKPFWPGQLLITVKNALRQRELELSQRRSSQNLENRHQAIIDMAPIGIYAKDAAGRYIVANSKADELAGLGEGDLIGLTDETLLSPEELEVGTGSDRRVFEERATHAREDTIEIGGDTKTFKTIRFPLFDGAGEVAAVGGISVDVSAENEAIRLRDEMTIAQRQAIEELRISRQETVERLAKAIDLHDASTGAHVERMAAIASFLSSRLGLDAEFVDLMRLAAPMHDVGKIGVLAEILRKPGPLTDVERAAMERHTVIGHETLADSESELLRMAATIALTHHERYDGSGYPRGLKGEEIPIEGRITAVADVFDALLTDRCYRPAFSAVEAVAQIEAENGTHFDPRVADLLLENVEEVFVLRTGSSRTG
jgi:PAS domain S-box-containing protein